VGHIVREKFICGGTGTAQGCERKYETEWVNSLFVVVLKMLCVVRGCRMYGWSAVCFW
jgi:hypothetical protein